MRLQEKTKEMIEKLENLDSAFRKGQISTQEYFDCYNYISNTLDKLI